MDVVARLEDGCRQVPWTACYQDNVLFRVMLQGSAATKEAFLMFLAATALSPSTYEELDILTCLCLQPVNNPTGKRNRGEWAASLSAYPVLG